MKTNFQKFNLRKVGQKHHHFESNAGPITKCNDFARECSRSQEKDKDSVHKSRSKNENACQTLQVVDICLPIDRHILQRSAKLIGVF